MAVNFYVTDLTLSENIVLLRVDHIQPGFKDYFYRLIT